MSVEIYGKLTCTEVYINPKGDEMVFFKDAPIVREEEIGTFTVPGVELAMTIVNPQCHGWYQKGRDYIIKLSPAANNAEPVQEIPASRPPPIEDDAEDAASSESEEVDQ